MAELVWGTPLFFDLWAAGMAGGAYFAAFLLNLFGVDEDSRLLKLATYIAVPLVLAGVVLIIADLGMPLRAFNMYIGQQPVVWGIAGGTGAEAVRGWPWFLNVFPLSPMSIGGWALVFFSVSGVLLIAVYIWDKVKGQDTSGIATKPVGKILTWIAFALAVLVMAYTGVVLSVSSMALWSATLLVPALFVASAIGTGVAALCIVVQLTKAASPGLRQLLKRALVVLIVIEILVLAVFLVWLSAAGLASPIVSGGPGLLLWIGTVVLGLVVPLVLEVVWKTRTSAAAMLVSPLLVVLGGLAMRAAVVIAGQL